MEEIRPCSCGCSQDNVLTKAARSGFVLYWTVRCMKCGRETAKHKELAGAVHEWNRREAEEK